GWTRRWRPSGGGRHLRAARRGRIVSGRHRGRAAPRPHGGALMRAGARLAAWAAALVLAPATTRAYFESSPAGARAMGLGNAFVCVADDASAVYWNPAGLV